MLCSLPVAAAPSSCQRELGSTDITLGREICLLDYIEGVGQPLGYYAHEMRRRGWNDVIVYLPHDGVATNNITGKRYIDHWTEAGFDCGIPIKNTGTGAAMMRISSQNGLRRPIALAGPGLGSRRRMSLAITGRPVDQDGRAGIAN